MKHSFRLFLLREQVYVAQGRETDIKPHAIRSWSGLLRRHPVFIPPFATASYRSFATMEPEAQKGALVFADPQPIA